MNTELLHDIKRGTLGFLLKPLTTKLFPRQSTSSDEWLRQKRSCFAFKNKMTIRYGFCFLCITCKINIDCIPLIDGNWGQEFCMMLSPHLKTENRNRKQQRRVCWWRRILLQVVVFRQWVGWDKINGWQTHPPFLLGWKVVSHHPLTNKFNFKFQRISTEAAAQRCSVFSLLKKRL